LVEQPNTEVVEQTIVENKEIITEGVTPIHDKGGGYVEFEDKLFQKDALKTLRPDLFSAKADVGLGTKSSSNFGTQFPRISGKGDIFVRVDVNPNRVYKFDGKKWIEVNKDVTQSYLYDKEYIKFLVDKIANGEYDIELLTDQEKSEIQEYLKGTQNT
jgi:hypothetical protein